MTGERPDRRPRTVLGHLGVGVLGLIGGVLAMIVLNDILAGIWPGALMVLAPLSLPLGALAGIVIAVTCYRRITA